MLSGTAQKRARRRSTTRHAQIITNYVLGDKTLSGTQLLLYRLLRFEMRKQVWFIWTMWFIFGPVCPLLVRACLHWRRAAGMKGLSRPLSHPRARVVQQSATWAHLSPGGYTWTRLRL